MLVSKGPSHRYFGEVINHHVLRCHIYSSLVSSLECTCNWLGADRNATERCDRETGLCPCLPNVRGNNCDECIPDHWKLASGEGCEFCDCDDEGSVSPQCDEFDGRCTCVEGRGGKKCDQCVDLFYGDPTVECFRESHNT